MTGMASLLWAHIIELMQTESKIANSTNITQQP